MDKRIFRMNKGNATDVRVDLLSSENGVEIYRVTMAFSENTVPSRVHIDWEEPMVNLLHVWHPTGGRDHAMRQWFSATSTHSDFCFGAPVLCTIGEGGKNTETVAVSDPCTPINISYAVKDLDQRDTVGYTVSFFTGNCSAMTDYTADIRIDRRPVPYDEAVRSVSPWWAAYGYDFPPCPAAAEDALYSSWYNFHQAPDADRLLADLKIAAGLGFRTVILDDGWQFAGPSSGNYSMCGAWEVSPDKFADFKAFTDGVHDLGMKLMVWFSVPFVGYDSPVYADFADKLLYTSDGLRAGIVDPRYPEVRAFIKDTYKRFLSDYGIDGFKLDFIDSFRPGDRMADYDSAAGAMDCETVEAAVRCLLDEITEELSEIKPDLLFEYRQNYVGPAINRYGNMLRVADCAYDSLTNRIGVVDLRLMGYPVAVHSDMLFWAKGESVTLCAKQLYNILFSVPQISVILANSTDEQRRLLRRYLDYWTENREILLHGTFTALHPELNYTLVRAETEKKSITALYTDLPYVWDGKDGDVLHNGDIDGIVFENPTAVPCTAVVYDCFGELLDTVDVAAGTMVRLPVPVTGMAAVKNA